MANRSLNKVMLIGNLTRDPELRYTPSGVAVCSFGLATNRRWNDSQGNPQESTEFHRIVAWAKLAELCSQLLFKGRKIYLEGRLQTREWSTQTGDKRTTTEIVIDNMLILDSKRKEEEVIGEPVRPAVKAEEAKPVAAAAPAAPAAPAAKADASQSDDDSDNKKKAKKEQDQEKVKKEDIPF